MKIEAISQGKKYMIENKHIIWQDLFYESRPKCGRSQARGIGWMASKRALSAASRDLDRKSVV